MNRSACVAAALFLLLVFPASARAGPTFTFAMPEGWTDASPGTAGFDALPAAMQASIKESGFFAYDPTYAGGVFVGGQ